MPQTSSPTPPSLRMLFAAAAVAPLGLNIVVPTLPAIGAAFERPHADVQLVVSLFLLLFGSTQLLLGPLSDRLGRRPVLLSALSVFVAASLWAVLATSLESLIWARAAQAAGGCAALVIPRAAVSDSYEGAQTVRAMALVTMAIAAVPAVAPLFGSLLLTAVGWRAVFLFCAGYGTLVFAWAWFGFGESLRPERRVREAIGVTATRYLRLLRSRSYLAYATNFSMLAVGFLLFVSLAPVLLIRELGVSPQGYGGYHLLLGVALVAGNLAAFRLSSRWGLHRTLIGGSLAAVLAFGLLLALSGQLGEARLIAPMLLYALANGIVFPLALTGAARVDPNAAGTAAALTGFLQMVFGAAGVYFVGQFGASTALPLAAFALASAVIGTIALAFVGCDADSRSRSVNA